MRKCFDAIASLEFGKMILGPDGKPVKEGEPGKTQMTNDILSMRSPEGEIVSLGKGLRGISFSCDRTNSNHSFLPSSLNFTTASTINYGSIRDIKYMLNSRFCMRFKLQSGLIRAEINISLSLEWHAISEVLWCFVVCRKIWFLLSASVPLATCMTHSCKSKSNDGKLALSNRVSSES